MQSTKMNIKRPVLVDELKSHQSAFLGNEIQGGPERMQHLRSILSRKQGTE